jgi:L-aspartate oxidase
MEEAPSDPQHWPGSPQDAHDIPELFSSRGSTILSDRADLQRLMWNSVGIERNGVDLSEALIQFERWTVRATDVQSMETANLLQLARVTARAALERAESRGAHFRTDYPESFITWEHSLAYAQRVPITC